MRCFYIILEIQRLNICLVMKMKICNVCVLDYETTISYIYSLTFIFNGFFLEMQFL